MLLKCGFFPPKGFWLHFFQNLPGQKISWSHGLFNDIIEWVASLSFYQVGNVRKSFVSTWAPKVHLNDSVTLFFQDRNENNWRGLTCWSFSLTERGENNMPCLIVTTLCSKGDSSVKFFQIIVFGIRSTFVSIHFAICLFCDFWQVT